MCYKILIYIHIKKVVTLPPAPPLMQTFRDAMQNMCLKIREYFSRVRRISVEKRGRHFSMSRILNVYGSLNFSTTTYPSYSIEFDSILIKLFTILLYERNSPNHYFSKN